MFSLEKLKREFPELEIISEEEEEQIFDILLLNFTAPTEKTYGRVTKWLDSCVIKKDAYSIHVSYDTSGYNVNQEELNYMTLTLVVVSNTVNMLDLIEDLAVLEEKLQFINQSSIDYCFYPNEASAKALTAALNAVIG